jgi:CRISPR-associated endoribonuclease Cas6
LTSAGVVRENSLAMPRGDHFARQWRLLQLLAWPRDGIEGTAVYEDDRAPFWPYLVFGQWTHVGSGATFGLGGYRIE